MPHSTYYYPRNGGIYKLIQTIAGPLTNIWTSYPLESLERINGKWIVNGEGEYDRIISTIPLKILAKACSFLPSRVNRAIDELKCSSLTTTLLDVPPSNLSWVYYPERAKSFHRLVHIGNFANNNSPAGRGSAIAEGTGKIAPLIQANEFGLQDVITSNYTEYAYIIFNKGYSRNIKIINEYFNSEQIYRVGRFAEWKYYNMDICIASAFRCVEEIIEIMQ